MKHYANDANDIWRDEIHGLVYKSYGEWRVSDGWGSYSLLPKNWMIICMG